MKPDSPRAALLQQEIATLRVENEALKAEIEELRQHNQALRLKVDAMARKLFGKSSEKLDAAQLQMVFDALQNEPQNAAKKADASDSAACDSEAEAAAEPDSKARRKRRSLDEIIAVLPVTEVIIDPQEVKADPAAWTCIGAEETRLIDYIPGKFACQMLVRRKYVRNDARHLPPITAPLLTLQDRCIATPRLLHRHTTTACAHPHWPKPRDRALFKTASLGLSSLPLATRTLPSIPQKIRWSLFRGLSF